MHVDVLHKGIPHTHLSPPPLPSSLLPALPAFVRPKGRCGPFCGLLHELPSEALQLREADVSVKGKERKGGREEGREGGREGRREGK